MRTTDLAELGAAMVACAYSNATSVREGRDYVEFNAWWRGGDDFKVRIYPHKAAWHDVKTESGGNAEEFAKVATGFNLRGFMEQYGPGKAPVRPAPSPAKSVVELHAPKDGWTEAEVIATWERHVERYAPCNVCPDCVDGGGDCLFQEQHGARAWLWEKRGIPVEARLESGILPAHAELFPDTVMVDGKSGPISARQWVAECEKWAGPSVLVPTRAADTNRVVGLVLRLMTPMVITKPTGRTETLKSLNVKGISRDRAAPPAAFGWAGAAARADHLVMVEGAPDTWACEALVAAGTAVVIGVNGVGALAGNGKPGAWTSWLAQHRTLPTTIIEQCDAAGTSQKACDVAARTLAAAGKPVALFPWASFVRNAPGGVDLSRAKDIADVTKAAAAAGVPWDAVRKAFVDALDRAWGGQRAR